MWLTRPDLTFRLAGERFANVAIVLAFRGDPIFRMWRKPQTGMLETSLDIFGDDSARLASVRNAYVVEGPVSRYAVESTSTLYRVTDLDSGRELVNLVRHSIEDAELEVSFSLFLPNGLHVQACPSRTSLGRDAIEGGSRAATSFALHVS